MRTTRLSKFAIIALVGLMPAAASAQSNVVTPEARVPDMNRYIEWKADGENGVFVRAYNGRWYYARTKNPCRRLDTTQRLSFRTAPNGDLDRYSSIVAEGWRCQLSSVVESAGPEPVR